MILFYFTCNIHYTGDGRKASTGIIQEEIDKYKYNGDTHGDGDGDSDGDGESDSDGEGDNEGDMQKKVSGKGKTKADKTS